MPGLVEVKNNATLTDGAAGSVRKYNLFDTVFFLGHKPGFFPVGVFFMILVYYTIFTSV